MDKQQLLDTLAREIESDQLLSELRESATQIVRGAGSFNAKVLFIGEAPGKKEDETGQPFVGASGKILDQGLEAAGLSRDEVYITNIVKYRPLNNRDPSKQEKSTSWPYLLREIEIIQPKIIAPLGRHSLSIVLPDAKIGQDHGRPINVTLSGRDYTVVPLYHPAATIYNRTLRESFFTDLVNLGKILESLN